MGSRKAKSHRRFDIVRQELADLANRDPWEDESSDGQRAASTEFPSGPPFCQPELRPQLPPE